MYVYKRDTMRVPVKIWSLQGSIEDGALEQIENAASLPFAFKHVALMPDGHQGYGAPIGGVLATQGVVVPNFVGVDIGCGMYSVKTYLHKDEVSTEQLKKIMGIIRETVPVGFGHNEAAQEGMPLVSGTESVVIQQIESASKQIGTLGGGNHFIEIQYDEEGTIWYMIHSGSRNLGKKVADHYNKVAKQLNEMWFSSVDPKWDLAFLPIETPEAKDYMEEMQYCVDFALANRALMGERVENAFGSVLDVGEFSEPINIAHNYAAWENHFGQNVIVHRKGATRARYGEVGIIPGSQGTASYIVEGLGNPDSFESCSHGAGRKMGRKDATRRLDLKEEIQKLDDQGIIHGIRNVSDLDEAAGAYKDIENVMEQQTDLVRVLVKLRPLAVVKG
jgi:tRNA-splicing ligase RtcB